MKRLTILRHAKSSWAEPHLDDFDRPLNKRGWRDARRMGRELRERGTAFDHCIASPAARVRETLDGLREGFGPFDFEVRFEPRLYPGGLRILLEVVRELPGSATSALLVGHNAGIERLVAELSREDARGLRHRVEVKFPTAALATIELEVEQWADVGPATGEIVTLIYPKDLD